MLRTTLLRIVRLQPTACYGVVRIRTLSMCPPMRKQGLSKEKDGQSKNDDKVRLKDYTLDKLHFEERIASLQDKIHIEERIANLQDNLHDKFDVTKENVSARYHSMEDRAKELSRHQRDKLKERGVENVEKIKKRSRETTEQIKVRSREKSDHVKERSKENIHRIKVELREKSIEQREKIKDYSHETVENVKEKGREQREKIKDYSHETVENVKEKGREQHEKIKDYSHETVENVKEKSREQREKIKDFSHEKVENVKEKGREVRAKTRERAIRENWYTVPNAISIGRLVIAPITGYCIINGHYHVALGLNVVSLISDYLDGKIARAFPSQQSAAGTMLDPLADKVTMLCVYPAFYLSEAIPPWLFFAIIGRDIALVMGVAVLRYQTLPKPRTVNRYFDFGLVNVKLHPTWISKTNTVFQFVLPIWLLTINSGYAPAYEAATLPLCALTFLTTSISTLEYFVFKRDLITGTKVLQKVAGI